MKILVTGPNADNQSILGDWYIFQPDDHVTTILEGIQAAASPEQSILYSNSGRNKAKKSDLSTWPRKMAGSLKILHYFLAA